MIKIKVTPNYQFRADLWDQIDDRIKIPLRYFLWKDLEDQLRGELLANLFKS